jgi:hypothetical protein
MQHSIGSTKVCNTREFLYHHSSLQVTWSSLQLATTRLAHSITLSAMTCVFKSSTYVDSYGRSRKVTLNLENLEEQVATTISNEFDKIRTHRTRQSR